MRIANLIILLFCYFFLASSAFAQEATTTDEFVIPEDVPEGLVATPSIIDEEVKKRDILDYTVTLTNNYRHKINFYTFVNDYTEKDGEQEFTGPSSLDRKTSIASWTTIKRAGTELSPGETIEIPLNIKVGQEALPGKRFAVISFNAAGNRPQAEAQAKAGGGEKIRINFNVLDDIVEKAQLIDFAPHRNVFVRGGASFDYGIENTGNREILPVGRMFIYDRRNHEVSELPLFQGEGSILAGEKKTFTVQDDSISGLGKYKARVEIEYGQKDTRDLQDTVYFWVIPIFWLAIIFVTLFVVLLLLTIIIFKRTYRHSHPLQELGHLQAEKEKEHVINLRK